MVGGELVCYFTSVVEEQIQLAAKAGLELGASESQVERSIRSATLGMLLGTGEKLANRWLAISSDPRSLAEN